MEGSRLRVIIDGGESTTVEFKESRESLSRTAIQTVCAFLNRNGGHLLLGIKDNGSVTGIDKLRLTDIKRDFVTAMNNPQKISPTFYLSVEEVSLDGQSVLYIYVPESSQVHRCNGRIYDRNEDGDLDITDNTNLVAAMYVRKQGSYTENRIYPAISLADFRSDLIDRARKLASLQRPDHPWAGIDDLALMKSAGLFLRDYQSGQEGFTLAAVLLLGKDEMILSVLPHHRTDAILRREDVDRYDDRDDIRTNLIESYERLRSFIVKHLGDKFYLEKDQRISLRDTIFREVIANILIHREYTNPYPAKMVILGDSVYTENSNKPHGHGIIDPSDFSPYPKNPTIAKFFKELGWVEELGSGIRNVHKYSLLYAGARPVFLEGDVFRATIPLTPQATPQVTPQATPQDEDRINSLLNYCKTPRTRNEMQELFDIKDRKYFTSAILKPLVEKGLLKLTRPDTPRSPNQKYFYEQAVPNAVFERDTKGY